MVTFESRNVHIHFRIFLLSMAHAQLRMTCLDVFVEGQAVHLVMPYMDTDLKKIIEDRRSRGITVSPGGVLEKTLQ